MNKHVYSRGNLCLTDTGASVNTLQTLQLTVSLHAQNLPLYPNVTKAEVDAFIEDTRGVVYDVMVQYDTVGLLEAPSVI